MADTLDVLTLPEAKAAIDMDPSDTSHDTELAAFITRVSRLLDDVCGPIVKRSVTEQHNGGCKFVILDDYPVDAITSVTEYDYTTATVLSVESAGTQPADGYLLDNDRVLYRRDSGLDTNFPPGRSNVVVVFTAGRYADTASVDERFKGAAAITLAHYWRLEHGMGTTTFGAEGLPAFGVTFMLPNAARELVQRDLRDGGVGAGVA